jgi:phytoene synthase
MLRSSVNSAQVNMADIAACRALLRTGSRTFYAASLVLPAQVRQAATALYAFCRLADDAVDQQGNRRAALLRLRERLDCIYAGRTMDVAADRAFAEVVTRFAIPKTLPEAMLEGFEWDLQARQYETLTELQAYAARVAGTVGSMMALLMGVRSAAVIARACDLGVAMQLTNIARDVGEDARMGRLYLPREWLREEGIDPDRWLAQPVFGPAIARVIKRLLAAAEMLYQRSALGIAWLPASCRPGMHAARLIYAEIGHELSRRGLNSIAERVHVSWQRKLQLLSQASLAAAQAKQHLPNMVLDEVRFLVEAASTAMHAPERIPAPGLQAAATGRVLWVLDLFERLERQELGLSREAVH